MAFVFCAGRHRWAGFTPSGQIRSSEADERTSDRLRGGHAQTAPWRETGLNSELEADL